MIKTLGKAGALTDPQRYLFYMRSMEISCGATTSDTPGDPQYTWKADVVDNKGGVTTDVNYIGTAKATDRRDIAGSSDTKNVACSDMAKNAKPYAKAYSLYLASVSDKPDTTTPPAGTTNTASSSTGTTTCGVAGIGWIICPISNCMASVADNAKGQLDTYMEVKAGTLFDTNGDIYKNWQQVRNIANILFVIGFMIIIYSQITGAGISNYGLKKLLPKLIVVAVMVNISFWVCALAADLSNLLGYSIGNLFGGLQISSTGVATGYWATGNTFTGIVVGVIGVSTVAYFALGALLAALVGVLFAVITILFILTMRSALIVLLVILSPLAMAALLLPNTEGLFKKWLGLAKTLLLIFPVISLLYGGGKIAQAALWGTVGDDKIMGIIVASIPFLMLYATYILLKKLLDGVAGAGALLNGIGKIRGAAEGKAKSAAENSGIGRLKDYRSQQAKIRRAQTQGGVYSGWNPVRRLSSRMYKGFNASKVSGNFGNKLASSGAGIVDAQDDEYLKNAGSRIDSFQYTDPSGNVNSLSQDQMMDLALGKNVVDSGGKVLIKSSSVDTHMRRAAVQRAAKIATVPQAELLAKATSARDANGNLVMSASERKNVSQSLAQSSVLGKSPYLSGVSLGQMQSGDFDLTKAVTDAVKSNKITAEALAGLDDKSAKTIFDTVNALPAGAPEKDLLKAAANELYKPGSKLTEKLVEGSPRDNYFKQMQTF
jgi:hypothetical protein